MCFPFFLSCWFSPNMFMQLKIKWCRLYCNRCKRLLLYGTYCTQRHSHWDNGQECVCEWYYGDGVVFSIVVFVDLVSINCSAMKWWDRERIRSGDRSIDVMFTYYKILESVSPTMALFFLSNSFVSFASKWNLFHFEFEWIMFKQMMQVNEQYQHQIQFKSCWNSTELNWTLKYVQ